MQLDQTDIQILLSLQQNRRITNVKLAESVGISAPSILERVRRYRLIYRSMRRQHIQCLIGFNLPIDYNPKILEQERLQA